MAADVKPEQNPVKEERYDHRAKRTQAVPKHTLFGSVIETLDEDDKKSIRQIDMKELENNKMRERIARTDRYKPKLPDYIKNQLPGDSVLEHRKEEFLKQVQQVSRARNLINVLEEKSKYFSVGSKMEEDERSYKGRPHQWMTEKDLEHAEDINILGLNKKSYNHAKYGAKPPVHQYSVIGDPLKLGMDFPDREKGSLPKGVVYKKSKGPYWCPGEDPIVGQQDKPKSAISLPPNIQHLFGTKICNSVLSDEEQVNKTIAAQNKLKASFYRKREPNTRRTLLSVDNTDPSYEQLGGALRQNMFPGHTYNHKQSQARSVYTDEVHKHRHPDPEQYRYQRDALSTWAEQNVLRDRVKKAWDQYHAETLGQSKS